MITRIEAYAYRCFPKLSVDLGPFHVLAGANGAGKTTLLDIPVLLGDMTGQQRVADAFLRPQDSRNAPRAHTLTELVYRERGESIMFVVEAGLPADIVNTMAGRTAPSMTERTPTHLRYELRLDIVNYELQVAAEYLFLFRTASGAGPRRGYRCRARGTPRDARCHSEPGSGRSAGIVASPPPSRPRRRPAARAFRRSGCLRPSSRWVRFPPTRGSFRPRCGSPSCCVRARSSSNPTGRACARRRLRGIPGCCCLPGATCRGWLSASPRATRHGSGSGSTTCIPRCRRSRRSKPSNGKRITTPTWPLPTLAATVSRPLALSEGTLRILTLSLLPYLPSSAMPRLLVTEEPENGIHPRAIETVVQSLGALPDSQVWVSTQSPIVLADIDLDHVLAARLDGDGSVSVIPGREHPQLRDWHGSIDLGTLFAAGVLS